MHLVGMCNPEAHAAHDLLHILVCLKISHIACRLVLLVGVELVVEEQREL